MPKFARKLNRIFVMGWGAALAYRGDIALWSITEAISPLIALAVWYTVSQAGQTSFTPRDTLTYYILTMLVLSATNSWIGFFLTQEILDGSIVKHLVRPFSVFWEHLADNLTVKVIRLAIPLPVFLLVAWTAPHLFSPSLYDPSRVTLALLSLAAGMAIAFLSDAALATLAFWIEDVNQIIGLHHLLWSFASGIMIPLALLPGVAQTIVAFLPYRYIISAPIEILLPSAQSSSATTLLVTQLMWILILAALLHTTWRRGLKRYAIPGQ